MQKANCYYLKDTDELYPILGRTAIVRWELDYNEKSELRLGLFIGGTFVNNFTPSLVQNGNKTIGEETLPSYILLGASKIELKSNDSNIILQVPHGDGTKTDVRSKDIVSLKIKNKDEASQRIQAWTLVYKRPTRLSVNYNSSADLKCYSEIAADPNQPRVIQGGETKS